MPLEEGFASPMLLVVSFAQVAASASARRPASINQLCSQKRELAVAYLCMYEWRMASEILLSL